MSSFYFDRVKRFKRGAVWGDGSPRLCTTCAVEGSRRRQAVVVADLRRRGSRFRVPVAYCVKHSEV